MDTTTLTLAERARAAYAAHEAAQAAEAAARDRAVAERRAEHLAELLTRDLGVTVAVAPNYADPTDGPTATVDDLTFLLSPHWDLCLARACGRCGRPAAHCPTIRDLTELGAVLDGEPPLCHTCWETEEAAAAKSLPPERWAVAPPTLEERLIAVLREFVAAQLPPEAW